ncbi:T9SS type A sorting domain-containing protein [Phaeocystidibacter luteus]|uniref:T9SS type A sorting domain-containing protein n=1 Tax=Phaeocystidibacter luteus TaxID=911197 RepID=A0A6N6RJI0_9FLAO|nr:T9SS type A sorting domain-containing protein [Phaeocystidibacter luteus]KAB2813873.1 T9SS type A sorting domain-containing protein [Phaeocystidibacter luteus]
MRHLVKTIALLGVMLLTHRGAAQLVSSQSISYSPQPVLECNSTGALVGVQKNCTNIALNGTGASIGADTTTIVLDYTLGPICLGAIANVTESVSVGQIPSTCTTIEVICNLNGTLDDISYYPITVGACCQVTADFNIIPSNTICIGDTVQFENASASATGFRWYEGSTLVSTSVDHMGLFSQPGQFQISLVAYDTACSDSITKTITMVDPSVDLGADTAVCLSAGYMLSAGANRDSVMWSTGETTNTIVVNQPGTYQVTTYTNKCMGVDSIVISGLTEPEVQLGADTAICVGDTLYLDVTQSGSATYLWNDGSTSATYAVGGPGQYYVMVTSGDGCMAADTIEVTLDSCFASLIENEISLSIYPNPTSGSIQIKSESFDSGTTLEVLSVSGQRVTLRELETGVEVQTVDLSELNSGVYMIRISNELGATTRRIIIE